jgi:hypothetical protein
MGVKLPHRRRCPSSPAALDLERPVSLLPCTQLWRAVASVRVRVRPLPRRRRLR